MFSFSLSLCKHFTLSPKLIFPLYLITAFCFLQLTFEETIDIAKALEIEAGLGVAELQEEVRGIDGIESLLHREAAFVHQAGDEILHNFLLHVLEFCLRYVFYYSVPPLTSSNLLSLGKASELALLSFSAAFFWQ